MSKISEIYDEIETLVSGELTTYRKLPNPYAAEDNAEIFLVKSYGIGIGPGNNTNRQIGGKKSYLRQFTVAIINQVTTTDHNLDAREALEKSIVEDHYKVLGAFEENPTLNGKAAKTIQVSDGGVEFLEGDRFKYLLIEIIIEAEYFEDFS